MTFLYQQLDTLQIAGAYEDFPKFIEENLTSSFELRPYQKKAFQNFITYYENKNLRNQSNNYPLQVLFHMATGSGKTVIMAGLIIYLYCLGYRNFLFFVNSDTIIKKTKENFLNSASSKYLFAHTINIAGNYVKIREVDNFQDTNKNDINICFTTIQGLHTKLTTVYENSITFEDFKDKKIVLIADEAHHLNVETRKNRKTLTNEQENQQNWETTVNTIFKSNKENILLEFTATCDLENPNIKNAYKQKIIIDYPLKNFRKDKYSKEVETLSVGLDLDERVIQAVLLSQYRLKLFQQNNLTIKPVILFKHKTITESAKYKKHFHDLILNLTPEKLLSIKNLSTAPVVKKMFEFFEQKTTPENLVEELKQDFSEDKCVSANDDKDVKNLQIQINTLEDRNNLIRCVFAVNKLNEGWDVLNLYDIVRLYETQSKKQDGTPEKQTIQEAQLIGRGARYCPFVLPDYADKFRRKFDNDLENDLRVCETLYYHCQHSRSYITELRKAMQDIGLEDPNTKVIKYELKDSFKQTEIYNSGFVFENSRQVKHSDNLIEDFPHLKNKPVNIVFPGGESTSVILLDDTENYNKELSVAKYPTEILFKNIDYRILNKALRKFENLTFDKLKKKYINLQSTREFLTDDNYLGNIQMILYTPQEKEISQSQYFQAGKNILEKVSKLISKKDDQYIGTKEFKAKKLKDIITDKKIQVAVKNNDGCGISQKDCNDEELRLNLSDKSWFAFKDNYGTTEEKAFVKYFGNYINKIRDKYDDIYLIRNERQLKLFSFQEGRRFEPDYILILTKSGEKPKYYHIFIEVKGTIYLETDKWKEDFLLEIEKEGSILIANDDKYKIIGLPFYNTDERYNEFDNEFLNLMQQT